LQQLVWSNFSTQVKSLWDEGRDDVKINICHVVYPNDEYDPRKIDSKFKRFSSCYYEKGYQGGSDSNYFNGTDHDKYLREKGYDLFPALAPRWARTGEDSWGTDCPGMTALGDIKMLQKGERRAMQAIDKLVNPPMNAPGSMRNQKATILPGEINYNDTREGTKGFSPVWEINPHINELEMKLSAARQRVQRCFYEDMFLMLSTRDTDPEKTAREINELHEEKLFALGPMMENMNGDLYGPSIDLTFMYMEKQGLLPPAPEEIQGQNLKIEYISMMAMAQKMFGVGTIERFLGTVGNIAPNVPSVLDKVDTDQLIDIYGTTMGVPAGIIRSDEDTAAVRQARAEAEQAAMEAEQIESASKTAKNLAQADTSGDNALTKLLKAAGPRRAA
jgi:hypothetical protein